MLSTELTTPGPCAGQGGCQCSKAATRACPNAATTKSNEWDLPKAGVVAWQWATFADLTARLVYEILRLRQQIFIVEQGVPYDDIDRRDLVSTHLLCHIDGALAAYLRVLPKDLFEPGFLSLGRVVVREDLRGQGLARALLERALAVVDTEHPGVPLKISSQEYLKDFYASLGFESQGEPYIEDRIPHIAMVRRLGA